MTRISIATKELPKPWVKALNIRKRVAWVNVTETVHMPVTTGMWSGGSMLEMTAINALTGATMPLPHPVASPFARDPRAELVMRLEPGLIIAETGWFCGKPATPRFYVHPANMPARLGAA